MIVGVCEIELFIRDSSSLKDKRNIIRSIKSRLKNKYNISIAETGETNSHKYATLGIATVSKDSKRIQRVISKAKDYIETIPEVMIIKSNMEIW